MQDSNPRKQSYEQNRAGGQRRDNFNQKQKDDYPVQKWIDENQFQEEWIKNGTDSEMIKYAEKAGEYMAKNGLTNSKIRSIYGEMKRIQMVGIEKGKASFLLLRPKVAYALGREKGNKKGLQLFKFIFDEASKAVEMASNESKAFNNFCNLFEAILAYHKAHGEKD
jgi:CRISPR-associated protein Csm2